MDSRNSPCGFKVLFQEQICFSYCGFLIASPIYNILTHHQLIYLINELRPSSKATQTDKIQDPDKVHANQHKQPQHIWHPTNTN